MVGGEGRTQCVLDQGTVYKLGIRHDKPRTAVHLRDLIGIQGVDQPLYLASATRTGEDFSNDRLRRPPYPRIDGFGKPLVSEDPGRGKIGDGIQRFFGSDKHRIRRKTPAIAMRQPTPVSQ